jgi:hypothetical protein
LSEAKRKPGRPSSFSDHLVENLLELAKTGATDEQLAAAANVSVATLNNWKGRHPSFLEALKKAKDVADLLVEASLYKRATGYSHKAVKFFCHMGVVIAEEYEEHYPPDTVACIFWLKNRSPERWRDKVQHEHTGDESKPIPLAYVPKSKRLESA